MASRPVPHKKEARTKTGSSKSAEETVVLPANYGDPQVLLFNFYRPSGRQTPRFDGTFPLGELADLILPRFKSSKSGQRTKNQKSFVTETVRIVAAFLVSFCNLHL